MNDSLLIRQRLIGTAVGVTIPLLILIAIGYCVSMGSESTQSYELVTHNRQPILAQAALFLGAVGFYIPGLLKSNKESMIGE